MKNLKALTKTQKELITESVKQYYNHLLKESFFKRVIIAFNILTKRGAK